MLCMLYTSRQMTDVFFLSMLTFDPEKPEVSYFHLFERQPKTQGSKNVDWVKIDQNLLMYSLKN